MQSVSHSLCAVTGHITCSLCQTHLPAPTIATRLHRSDDSNKKLHRETVLNPLRGRCPVPMLGGGCLRFPSCIEHDMTGLPYAVIDFEGFAVKEAL